VAEEYAMGAQSRKNGENGNLWIPGSLPFFLTPDS